MLLVLYIYNNGDFDIGFVFINGDVVDIDIFLFNNNNDDDNCGVMLYFNNDTDNIDDVNDVKNLLFINDIFITFILVKIRIEILFISVLLFSHSSGS